MNRFSPEFSLLTTCLHPDAGIACDRLAAAIPRPVNWRRFVEVTVAHGVYPVVALVLEKAGASSIPLNVFEELRSASGRNALRMLRLAVELRRLAVAMDSAGIRVMTFKGPALAQRLYGDTALRTAVDLDLYVRMEDVAPGDALLREAGFVRFHPGQVLTAKQEMMFVRHAGHAAYRRDADGLLVELHWRFSPFIDTDFDRLWARRVPVAVCDAAIPMPCDGDLLRLLVLHGAQHKWSQLRWLYDVALFLALRPDAVDGHQAGQIDSVHLGGAMGQTCLLLRRVLGIEPPPLLESVFAVKKEAGFLAGIALKSLESPGTPHAAGRINDWIYQSRLYGMSRYFTRQYLKPDSRLYRRIPLPDRFYFLYYLLNPLYRLLLLAYVPFAVRVDRSRPDVKPNTDNVD